MTALSREGAGRFRVRLGALAGGSGGARRAAARVDVDPYLVGRAIAEVMRACTVRSATGAAMVWNDYRVVLAREDYEALGPLRATLEGDLAAASAIDADERGASRVGPMRVSVVADESDELAAGEAVVRAAFTPERGHDGAHGLETVRGDVAPPMHTVAIAEPPRAPIGDDALVARVRPVAAPLRVRWPGGEARVPVGGRVVLGRPHPGAPDGFVALVGASTRINKVQVELVAGARAVAVRRLPAANPVEVDGGPLAAGDTVEAALPATISLSKGDLVLTVSRR